MSKVVPTHPGSQTHHRNVDGVLTACFIQDLLVGFSAAIERDQQRADAIPASQCHFHYDPELWMHRRADYLKFIGELLTTVGEIPAPVLALLSGVAQQYCPAVVSEILLNLLADGASGEPDLLPAQQFFEQLMADLDRMPFSSLSANSSPCSLATLWFPTDDLLQISRDPECQYRLTAALN